MGFFKAIFGGGDASDSNENIRKADESFDEYAERIKGKLKIQPEDVTLENLDKLNRDAALESGLITQEQYLTERRKQHFRSYYNDLEAIANKKDEAREATPVSDWYLSDNGYMVRDYNDGSTRRD